MYKLKKFLILIYCISGFACSKPVTSKIETSNSGLQNQLKNVGSNINYYKGCGFTKNSNYGCNKRKVCVENPDCIMALLSTELATKVPESIFQMKYDSIYNLRDYFLINYDIGQTYITYYYSLSNFAIENGIINNSNYLDFWSFGLNVLEITNNIRFGLDDNIPISLVF